MSSVFKAKLAAAKADTATKKAMVAEALQHQRPATEAKDEVELPRDGPAGGDAKAEALQAPNPEGGPDPEPEPEPEPRQNRAVRILTVADDDHKPSSSFSLAKRHAKNRRGKHGAADIVRGLKSNIKGGAVNRIKYRSGVLRADADSRLYWRVFTHSTVSEIVRLATILADHSRSKTLKPKHVVHACKLLGLTVYPLAAA